MNPKEFASKHLQPFREKNGKNGRELTPAYCPYCAGGKKGDKHTFSLNVDMGVFQCLRGSCGKQGHFSKLCEDFDEEADPEEGQPYKKIAPTKKEYEAPKTKIVRAESKAADYLKLRGFSQETWEARGVGQDVKGNIVFPYYMDGKVVLYKFRRPEKHTGGKKAWREAGGKPIFWGMDKCDPEKPLVIVEGEYDALACDEAGAENVVSVPSGNKDLDCIDLCWEWLETFKDIVIWGDKDAPGLEMVGKLAKRLGEERCRVVECEHKDANEALHLEGPEYVIACIDNAKPIPFEGLIDLADVEPFEVDKVERVKTNIKWLDNTIGGLVMGELSVWTGKNGGGKSTFLGQMLIESVNQREPVCAYSGELRADRFQYWAHLQAAGKKNIKGYFDPVRNREVSYVDKETTKLIKAWYRGKFFLYDNDITTKNAEYASVLRVFEYAAKRHGCRMFLVDNLMTSRFTFKNKDDYWLAQSDFVGELVAFAKHFNSHVHLVAHPKKTKDKLTKEDISGIGDITNRADNVFSVERLDEDKKRELGTSADAVVTVLKNRSDGVENEEVGLIFCTASKRFWQPSDEHGPNKVYGWESMAESKATVDEVLEDKQMPWDTGDGEVQPAWWDKT